MEPSYIIRAGTNVRALQQDGVPVIVDDDRAADAVLDFYEPRVPLRAAGPLELMAVADWHARFGKPKKQQGALRTPSKGPVEEELLGDV